MPTPSNHPRVGTVQRLTKETQIELTLTLAPSEGSINGAVVAIDTPLPFFNHMLNTLACHGRMGLQLKASGDVDVDPHHLIEDVGIALGKAITQALGGHFSGIERAGGFSFPMDGTLATVALDVCGRGHLVWHVPPFESATVGTLDPRLFKEFFKGLVDGLALTLHVNVPYRDNDHHVVEAIFKAFARSLHQALTPLVGEATVLSTKGILEAPGTVAHLGEA